MTFFMAIFFPTQNRLKHSYSVPIFLGGIGGWGVCLSVIGTKLGML